MSWGVDLWDQLENISLYTQKGIDLTEKFAKFVKELGEIESEYATKLKRLWKAYQPKKREEQDYEFTCAKGFVHMTKEIHDMANQHDMISENLSNKVVKELMQLAAETKADRKKHVEEAQKHQKSLSNQLDRLDKSKKKYERGFQDSVKAKELYEKADNDINLSRADVEKAKVTSQQKAQSCEQCKVEYASELEKTNSAQREHYQTSIPSVFQQLSDMENKRIMKCQEVIKQCATIHRDVTPIINTCIDGMVKAAEGIDPNKDLQIVITRHKSGFQPPGDIPFEDLGSGQSTAGSNSNLNHAGSTPKHPNKDKPQTFSNRNKTKKRNIFGIFGANKGEEVKEDFSHLPPQQQNNELQKKIDHLKQTIATETAQRDGLIKMRDVYVKNPALGNAATVDKQVEENAHKLDNLNQELKKFEQYLEQAAENLRQGGVQRRQSDRSQSSGHTGSLPGTPQQQRASEVSSPPEPKTDREQSYESRDFNDSFEDDDIEEIGECQAIYAFDGGSQGSLPMQPGESLVVIEQDQGDGWTRVRRKDTGDEGFVPTSYVKVTMYP